MKAISLRIVQGGLVTLLAVCVLVTAPAFGQSGGDYVLSWHTIDSGGGTSSAGPYELTATIGQPDAAWSSGGEYELLGGFWPGGPLCIVKFDDFAGFAEQWLDTGGGLAGDLDSDKDVDFGDFSWFADYWLDYCPYGWLLK